MATVNCTNLKTEIKIEIIKKTNHWNTNLLRNKKKNSPFQLQTCSFSVERNK